MKNKTYIYRANLKEEIINYFELHKFEKIKLSHFLSIIYEFVKYKIRSLSRKVLYLYSFNNGICEEEIQNYIYSILIDIIENWKNFLQLPFEAYFWNTIKLKMINYINSVNNRQFDFEEKLANNLTNLGKINYFYHHTNGNNDERKYYDIDYLKKIISKVELDFITDLLNKDKKETQFYSTYQKNKIIKKINLKIKKSQELDY
ncbi:hypothetical protein [Mycoplasmopsis columboralis]|uniref:Uncharacterized protein n=1 Tax=Mycoplasmopsis columboralis TaxID=171282 RepID=A0A449B633_9BACT|nr:hypothetical protein [Mycoplasmopsis columboralis]VEU76032.1 Uncharacterised protein [Mycoplasmopsis columboralis]